MYDIAPSRMPLLVSMTNRCLLVGSARRRHTQLSVSFTKSQGVTYHFQEFALRRLAPIMFSPKKYVDFPGQIFWRDSSASCVIAQMSRKQCSVLCILIYTSELSLSFNSRKKSSSFLLSFRLLLALGPQLGPKDILITVASQLIMRAVTVLIVLGRKMWNATFSIPRSFHLIKAS